MNIIISHQNVALYERIPDLAPMASTPIPLPRHKESPYTKVCSLRRQSSSPASSLSFNSSDSPTNLQSVLKNTRHVQSLCSPKNDLDDVFDDAPKPADLSKSPAQNGFDSTKVEQVTSALSTLMKANGSETSTCTVEDNSLQDFEVIGTCEEATETATSSSTSYIRSGVRPSLPSPDVLGCGNPFLIFLCLTVLLQHRDSIVNRSLDSNEMAMHFDRLVRKHNVERVLSQARTLYYRYVGHFNTPSSNS